MFNPRLREYKQYEVDKDSPLLEYLLATLPGSRSKIKGTLQGRGIKVNGKMVTQFDYPLRKGDKISVSQSKKNDTFKSRYVSIVYEDQYIIVIEKKPGILSMAAGHSSLNVKTVLDEYFKKTRQSCRAHVVHRLDRDTSGLMIYAKDMDTEQILEHEWHDIVFDRRYVALCSGEYEEQTGTIASWLKDNKAYVTYSSPVDNGGKYAVTHYWVLDSSVEHSLVEFKLETGRKNQIRVQTATHLGCPVSGDSKYGNGKSAKRLCLHANGLSFIHPVTHRLVRISSNTPRFFNSLV